MNQDLLRFSVIGSVDHGKSTLIGRLLYDSKSIYEDQLLALEEASKRRGESEINLAHLTDGLRDEREKGITIDVAYRYFSTPNRKFIIADCPGHQEYTRNMITGSSNTNLTIVLIDAKRGLEEQTKKHCFIASLLKIKHLIVCVNKMDLVDYSKDKFESVKDEFKSFISRLDIPDIQIIPISALKGDNIVNKSKMMSWYEGSSLIYSLENIHLGSEENLIEARFPVQTIIGKDFPAGKIEGGVFKTGDKVTILPSNKKTKIKRIFSYDQKIINEAFPPMSIVMELEQSLKIQRGHYIIKQNRPAKMARKIPLMLCWLDDERMSEQKKYIVKLNAQETTGKIEKVHYLVDINTLHKKPLIEILSRNDIGKIDFICTDELIYDSYDKNRNTGSLILIDPITNYTVAAGIII